MSTKTKKAPVKQDTKKVSKTADTKSQKEVKNEQKSKAASASTKSQKAAVKETQKVDKQSKKPETKAKDSKKDKEVRKVDVKSKDKKAEKSSAKSGKTEKKTMSQKAKVQARDLDKKDRDLLVKVAKDMLKSKLTIRQAVEKHNIPRATLHKRIHNHLPGIDADLYAKLKAFLEDRSRSKAA